MPEDNKKILPKDFDSDYSLPGRLEESNSKNFESEYFEAEYVKPKSKNRALIVSVIAFTIISAGFFSYYFLNQAEIDSQIIENTPYLDSETILAKQYGVGEYGSDHAHAAILVVLDGEQLNFGLSEFQLSSKYIHFENHNPYLIHRHATDVPLEMLFVSFGMKITSNCIILNFDESANLESNEYCGEQDQSVSVYLNGEKYHSDISQYVLKHDDRVLISYGDDESVSKHLKYLESLEIHDVPKKTPQYSGNNISV